MSVAAPLTGKNLDLILLDRDGVINVDSADYIKDPHEWHALRGSLQAIANLQKRFRVSVCTNQSGVARGYFNLATLDAIHEKFLASLHAHGGKGLDIHFCPHGPDTGCFCRKPRPGLLIAAMQAARVEPQRALYVGDSFKDYLAAHKAGCGFALVLTGNGRQTLTKIAEKQSLPCPVFDDLAALAQAISGVPPD